MKRDQIPVIGPLGNGFTRKEGKAVLIGGGIGIPPMLALAEALHAEGVEVSVVLGYRDSDLFLKRRIYSVCVRLCIYRGWQCWNEG